MCVCVCVVRSNVNVQYLFVHMLVNNKEFITLLNSGFGDMVPLCFCQSVVYSSYPISITIKILCMSFYSILLHVSAV